MYHVTYPIQDCPKAVMTLEVVYAYISLDLSKDNGFWKSNLAYAVYWIRKKLGSWKLSCIEFSVSSGPNRHQSAVTCLQFNKNFVITSSDDGTVKIWDLKTGEFCRNLVALDSGGSGGVVWRIRCNNTKLVCAVGSRNGTEETKLLVLDFDAEDPNDPRSSTSSPGNTVTVVRWWKLFNCKRFYSAEISYNSNVSAN